MIKSLQWEFSYSTALGTIIMFALMLIINGFRADGGAIVFFIIVFMGSQLFALLSKWLFGKPNVILTAVLSNILFLAVFYLILFCE